MNILQYCKINYVQRGAIIMTNNLNGYFRTNRVTFSIPYKNQPSVSVSVVNYQNSNISVRIHPLVSHVSNTYFDVYVADHEGQIAGNASENAFTVFWIAIGEIK